MGQSRDSVGFECTRMILHNHIYVFLCLLIWLPLNIFFRMPPSLFLSPLQMVIEWIIFIDNFALSTSQSCKDSWIPLSSKEGGYCLCSVHLSIWTWCNLKSHTKKELNYSLRKDARKETSEIEYMYNISISIFSTVQY